MYNIVFPSKSEASKTVDGENWWTSDGKRKDFFNGNTTYGDLDLPLLDNASATWFYFKINLDTFTSGVIRLSLGFGHYPYDRHNMYFKDINRTAFSAAGLNSGIVCISVYTPGAYGENAVVYFNGHLVTGGISQASTGYGYTDRQGYMTLPEGVEVASVMFTRKPIKDKPLRWWYVRNLETVTQLSEGLAVDPVDTAVGFSDQDSYHIEYETDFQPREGSTYPAVYIEAFARHERNSVQFGTAKVRSTLNSKDTLQRQTWSNADYALTLLDVGNTTMTNVGGHIVPESVEDLKRIGFRAELTHVDYEE